MDESTHSFTLSKTTQWCEREGGDICNMSHQNRRIHTRHSGARDTPERQPVPRESVTCPPSPQLHLGVIKRCDNRRSSRERRGKRLIRAPDADAGRSHQNIYTLIKTAAARIHQACFTCDCGFNNLAVCFPERRLPGNRLCASTRRPGG